MEIKGELPVANNFNKKEASGYLRRAVFFHRQDEIRDRTFENQSSRPFGTLREVGAALPQVA